MSSDRIVFQEFGKIGKDGRVMYAAHFGKSGRNAGIRINNVQLLVVVAVHVFAKEHSRF